MVHAGVHVHVAGQNARAVISMTFKALIDTSQADWEEIVYEVPRMMPDPAQEG